MLDTRLYDAYRLESSEWIPSPEIAVIVLLAHTLAGTALVFWVARKNAGISYFNILVLIYLTDFYTSSYIIWLI